MEQLRSLLWSEYFRLDTRGEMPPIRATFAASEHWGEQSRVLKLDMDRMSAIGHVVTCSNAKRIVMRHACCLPAHGYTQGNLYLLYPIMSVLRNEHDVFWAYLHACQLVCVYGPLNRTVLLSSEPIPDWVIESVTTINPTIDVEWLRMGLSLRWIYPLWGQSIPNTAARLACLDYVFKSRLRILRFTASMLRNSLQTVDFSTDNMEQLQSIFEFKIESARHVAVIIANAESKYGRIT